MATRRHRFETPGDVVVRISVPSGDFVVEAVDLPHVDVEASPLRGSQEAVDALRIEAVERAGRHEVVVEAPPGRFGLLGRRPDIALRIACPTGSEVDVSTAAGDLRAGGRLGAVRVRSASGDVAVETVASLSVQSASGDVIAREVEGDVSVKTTSGDLLATTVGGEVNAAVVSGDLRIDAIDGDLKVTTVSGDVEIRQLGGAADVNSVSGDVELRIVRGRRLWLDVRSATGDVGSDLETGDEPSGGDAPVAELTVRTVSGDVRIRRARTGADVPR